MDAVTAIVDALRNAGPVVAPKVRSAILAAGERAVAPLVAIMNDDEPADARAPHGGWAPIHAVELLADLGSAAVEPMLDVLEATEFDHVIHDRMKLVDDRPSRWHDER